MIVGLSSFILLWNTSLIIFDAVKSLLLLVISPCRKKNKVFPSINMKDAPGDNEAKKKDNSVHGDVKISNIDGNQEEEQPSIGIIG